METSRKRKYSDQSDRTLNSVKALCLPNYSKGRQNIESKTPIELSCTTPGVLIFFSLNGRRPDPLETWNRNTATCIQYDKPFTFDGITDNLELSCRFNGSGLRTIRALAVDERFVHSSAVVTKTFYVKDVSDPLKVVTRSKTNSLRLRMSTIKGLDTAVKDIISQSLDEKQEDDRENEDEIELDETCDDLEFGMITDVVGLEDETELTEFVPEITNYEEIEEDLDEARNHFTPITPKEHSNELLYQKQDEEKSKPYVKDSSLQCVITSECSEKSIQVSRKCKDVGNQATVAFRSQALQTIPLEKEEQNPIKTARKGSFDTVTKKATFETESTQTITIDQRDAETETVLITDNGRKESGTRRTSVTLLKESRVSPGRGYWRQQMDHIAAQLKAEACNNLEFRDSIMKQRITKLTRVSLHEGLDDLVLVLNFGLQRATIENIDFDQ